MNAFTSEAISFNTTSLSLLIIAAGRSYYDPLVDNDTPENRATNRRTRIIIMPKIDQFYDMIEKEMQNLSN